MKPSWQRFSRQSKILVPFAINPIIRTTWSQICTALITSTEPYAWYVAVLPTQCTNMITALHWTWCKKFIKYESNFTKRSWINKSIWKWMQRNYTPCLTKLCNYTLLSKFMLLPSTLVKFWTLFLSCTVHESATGNRIFDHQCII